MAVNKVEINGESVIDLTKDTVLPQTLLSGVTAHNAAGERIVGAVAPVRYDVAQNLTSEQKKQAQDNIGAGDFATKTEAQGYVADHNQSATAHSDIREALSKAGGEFIIEGMVTLDIDNYSATISGITATHDEVEAALTAKKNIVLRLADADDGAPWLSLRADYQSILDDGAIQLLFEGPFGIFQYGSVYHTGISVIFYVSNVSAEAMIFPEPQPCDQDPLPPAPEGNPGGSIDYARGDHVHPSERPKAAQVTLTAAGWDSSTKKQTVTVPGVLADTSKQVIWVTQTTEAAIDAYLDAGIVPVAQGANSVTFRADTIPTAAIDVTVVMQEVQ